jgi:Ca2+-transporting ATPase
MAVEQGRSIFNNIRKFIVFLLSGNLGEILIVGAALSVGAALPLLPLQILYLNMLSDVFPALALGVGPDDPSVMERPPRPAGEPLVTNRMWLGMAGWGVLIAATVLASYAMAGQWLGMDRAHSVTVSFLTLAFARFWHTFNMREAGSGLLRNEITRNPFVWGALALCSALLLLAVYTPPLALALQLQHPGAQGWTLILGMSLVPFVAGQAIKSLSPLFSRGT